MDYESLLNDKQLAAVKSSSQYLRIIAGAGSGKTRVLTYRISYLISNFHVDPSRILAIAFTNKVAHEMNERASKLVDELLGYTPNLHISTFHAFCSKFLRVEHEAFGYPSHFTIFDEDDQKRLIKNVAVEFGYKKSDEIVKTAIEYIRRKKGKGLYPWDIKVEWESFKDEKTCHKMYTRYEEAKTECFALDFDDLLLKTIMILDGDPNIQYKWSHRFDHILVDEFQDTDTVQRDLIYLLSKGKDKKFRDGCFFLVGDPKQSIYAFRGADLSVYENTKNELMSEKIDNVFFYDLQRNHRSEDKIINWVNEEFKKDYGIGKDYLEMTYAHEGKNDELVLNGVYTLNNPKAKADFYKKKKDNIEKESEFLVELIKKIKKDYKINEFQRVDGKFIPTYRNITNKDFLVLSPKKPVLEVYAEKLKEAGIPINLYGALDLANDPAVLRFKALYHYLINPNDRKALYGAKEIFAQNYITKQNNKDASERLEKFKSECENKLPHELLEYLAHHVEYFMDKNTNKSQVVYLESRLQQLLEYLLSYGILNASDYDSLIDKYMKSGVDKELSIVQGEDAVRLMNLHKSKGLEGKIVIVLARCKEQNDKNDSYRNMYEYYPSIKSGAMGSVISSYNPYTDEDGINPALSRKSEKKRLEYVEATRAEEALIFFDALDSNCIFSDYNFDKATNLCSIDNDIDYLYNKILEENKHVSISNIEYKEKDIPEDNFNIHINDYQKTKDYINASPSDFEQEYKDDWTPASENRPMGACFGTILHRVFELAVLSIRENKNVDKSKIINQSMIESLIELENEDKNYFSYHLREYPKYLMNLLDNFINSDLIEEIKCAKYVYPEYKFNLFIDANESKECIDILKEGKYYLNGKADLVLVNEDHILVIDYKTDHKGDYSNQELYKHLEDTYSNQQRMYCVALSKCFKIDRDKINYKFYHLYN